MRVGAAPAGNTSDVLTIALTLVLIVMFAGLVAANLRPVQPPRYSPAQTAPSASASSDR